MPRTNSFEKAPIKHVKRGANKLLTPEQTVRDKYLLTVTGKDFAATSPDKPLTDKQRQFVMLWASGETPRAASLRAGYADDTIGYRLISMPAIRKVYEAEKVKYEQACDMSRKRVMEGFLEAIEMAKIMAEPMVMISGWREVGKMCGYYEPIKHEVNVNVNGELTVRQLTSMSDAELAKLIRTQPDQAAPMLQGMVGDGEEVDE